MTLKMVSKAAPDTENTLFSESRLLWHVHFTLEKIDQWWRRKDGKKFWWSLWNSL